MKDLVINGFKFPNDKKMRLAIAQLCAYISDSDRAKIGVSSDCWRWAIHAYNASTLNSDNCKFTKMMMNHTDLSENSPFGKIFIRRSAETMPWVTARLFPNEFTKQVADMRDQFLNEQRENVAKNKEAKHERLVKLTSHWKNTQPGDHVKINPEVLTLSRKDLENLSYPDSYYLEHTTYNGQKHYTPRQIRAARQGILLGFENIRYNSHDFTVAIVQFFKAKEPARIDPRCMIKA